MRLLTHNQLICIVKGCTDNFPLNIIPTKIENQTSECQPDFIRNIISRLDYPVLRNAASMIGINTLPESLPSPLTDETIQMLHNVLIDTHIIEGNLQCNKCGRLYNITNGIPNMMLNENET